MSLKDVNLGLVETWEDAQDLMRWIGERRPVLGFDLETTGLNNFEPGAKIRLAQIGDAKTGWAVPFERWGGLLSQALARYDGPMVIHNVAFEGRWMATGAADIPLPWDRIDDTMIMQRVTDSTYSAALKVMAKRLLGRDAALGQEALDEAMTKNKWTWATVPINLPAYWVYSAMDPVLTARVWEHFQKPGVLQRKVYETEMQVRRICTAMELRGFRIDKEYSKAKFDTLSQYQDEVDAYCQRKFDVSIGSTVQIGKYMEANGIPITERTATGRPKVDKFVLKAMAAEGVELAQLILHARKAGKLAGTYFRNFIDWESDGILHPNINTLAARTGRMSVTQPALQTLNKGDSIVRDAFLPRQDDHGLLTADYEQIEMRLIAHFSGDRNLIEAFNTADATGGDFFTVIGKQIYGPSFEKADKRRGLVKNVMYASGYGAGIPKIAMTAGVPLSVMEPVANAVFSEFPGIKGLQRTLIDRAMKAGMLDPDGRMSVTTPTGRKLIVEEDRSYTATNYMVQGHAAEVLKRAIINLDNAGLGEYMVLPVHDEMLFSVPLDLIDEVKPVISECMTFGADEGYALKLPADPDGPYKRWGEPYA